MELGKKLRKQCKKFKKKKTEKPEKKLKIDTPCKGVDAKYPKKNILISSSNDKNKLNTLEKICNNKNNLLKTLNNINERNLSVTKNFNIHKNCSALTEDGKEGICNDKMTKVAAPVVKMVEPLLGLIDFEEEIKVEKISKDCITPEIISDSNEEIKEDENKINKISENKKRRKKINTIKVYSENNSNSNDSNLSENSIRSVSSESSQIKSVTLRRNPSRRISFKEERADKIHQQNEKRENKKGLSVQKTSNEINNIQKKTDLPLNYKEPNQNNITSDLEKKTITNIQSNVLSHVPTMVDDNIISSTSKKNVNTNSKTENLENVEELKNIKLNQKKSSTQNNKRDLRKNVLRKALNKTELKVEIENNIAMEDGKDNNFVPLKNIEKINEIEEERSSSKPCQIVHTDSIMETKLNKSDLQGKTETDNEPECESQINENCVNNIEIVDPFLSVSKMTEDKNTENDVNLTVDNSNLLNISESKLKEENLLPILTVEFTENKLENKSNSENNFEEVVSTVDQEILKFQKIGDEENNTEIENSELNAEQETLKFQKIEDGNKISEIGNSELKTNILERNNENENRPGEHQTDSGKSSLCQEKLIPDKMKEEEKFTDEILKHESLESNQKEVLIESNIQKESEERFFIFDEAIEEEISICCTNPSKLHILNVEEQICGEIIHKKKNDFSINCYMCWDDDKWTFKKFSNLKLFSAHLNSEHSSDQIHLQNRRGNSYSLDFVNENSCVMPQSMWFGIYNEMISYKCGFAKIASTGYILYSCLRCKHDFRSFSTFTKHILGRENKKSRRKNCNVNPDLPKPYSDNSISLNLFNTSDTKPINNEQIKAICENKENLKTDIIEENLVKEKFEEDKVSNENIVPITVSKPKHQVLNEIQTEQKSDVSNEDALPIVVTKSEKQMEDENCNGISSSKLKDEENIIEENILDNGISKSNLKYEENEKPADTIKEDMSINEISTNNLKDKDNEDPVEIIEENIFDNVISKSNLKHEDNGKLADTVIEISTHNLKEEDNGNSDDIIQENVSDNVLFKSNLKYEENGKLADTIKEDMSINEIPTHNLKEEDNINSDNIIKENISDNVISKFNSKYEEKEKPADTIKEDISINEISTHNLKEEDNENPDEIVEENISDNVIFKSNLKDEDNGKLVDTIMERSTHNLKKENNENSDDTIPENMSDNVISKSNLKDEDNEKPTNIIEKDMSINEISTHKLNDDKENPDDITKDNLPDNVISQSNLNDEDNEKLVDTINEISTHNIKEETNEKPDYIIHENMLDDVIPKTNLKDENNEKPADIIEKNISTHNLKEEDNENPDDIIEENIPDNVLSKSNLKEEENDKPAEIIKRDMSSNEIFTDNLKNYNENRDEIIEDRLPDNVISKSNLKDEDNEKLADTINEKSTHNLKEEDNENPEDKIEEKIPDIMPKCNVKDEYNEKSAELLKERILNNVITTCKSKDEGNEKTADTIKEGIPDVYGYKKIASALFSIFDKDEDDSVSNKLNKILSLGKTYRDIKEKEKLDVEEKEKEKIKMLSLNHSKDLRPKLEGAHLLTKNILDINDKMALLTCKFCPRRFSCLTNLREHFRVHVGDRIILCYMCKRGFSKKSTLDDHIKLFHVDSLNLNVDLDVLGDNRKEIAKNTSTTTNENNPKEKGYKCQYCLRFLSNRTVLEEHLRLHFGEKPCECAQCDLQFLKKSVYDNHLIEVHGPPDGLHNLESKIFDKENNKPLSKKRKLNNKKKNKSKSKSKFKCNECVEFYPTKIGLIEHVIVKHNNGVYKCRFCEETYDSTIKRFHHEKIHETNKKFQCSFCEKIFKNLFTLETHENTHKQEANFKCGFCDYYFVSENTRNLHEEIHEAADEKKDNLKVQTVDMATIVQMNNEQASISSNGNANDSNGTSSDATDRSSNQNTTSRNLMVKKIIKKIKRGKRDPNSPLDCRYCKQHFESPHQLSYHERLHEIGKKFQCNLCDKIMATSYALELHLTAHLRKKNFNKGFVTNKLNGATILANQLALNRKKEDFKPKIEIVSDVTLAPNQTMEILTNFFKRDTPAITVATTSEDDSFQKIGADDIEKNLTAHVLRDTDPYYQLMADFSYQYQLYQAKSVPGADNTNHGVFSKSGFIYDGGSNEISQQPPKKGRKKRINNEKLDSITETINEQSNLYNEQNNFELQPEKNSKELPQSTILSTENDESKESNKKKEKKKISPDITKNIASAYIKCEYCNKKYNASDKKILNRHRRLHIAGDAHKCSFCNKCFATLHYLDKHLRVHHLNNISEYKCQLCDSVYALKESLLNHEIRVHKKKNLCINSVNEQEFAVPAIPKPKRKTKPKSKELKLFDCDFCEKSFPTSYTLQIHIDRVHKKNIEDFEANYNFKCTYENCRKKFDCRTNLDRHLRLHQSGYKCSICDKKTLTQILLDHHMRSHGLQTTFTCNYCKSKFTMQLSKDIHERRVHSKGSIYVHPGLIIKKLNMSKRKISYRCYNCKKSFSSLILLKAHTMYKHPVFECNTCPAMFSKINDLEEHEKIHLKTLQCNLCDKTFENKHTLYKHRRQHETKFFKCNMCPAEFSFRDELNEHKKNHDESERPFKCVELGCDKAFVVETFLNTHLKKIHGYFLFNCDRCKREFLKEDLLIEHRKEHEILSNDKQYRCDQCFKDFSTLTILKIHQKLHQSSVVAAAADAQTPDPQKTSKLKLYTCEQCDKRFSIVTYLNNHLKKVHQVKLFVCESCKMEFRNEKDLQEHSKVHSTGKKFIRVEKTHLDRPFKCELCGNSYAILAYLNNHLNKAHGNDEIPDEPKDEIKLKKINKNQNGKKISIENNESPELSNKDVIDLKLNAENSNVTSNGKIQEKPKLPPLQENAKKNNSIKCDHCYLRFISQKHLTEHSKMHLDPNDSSRIEMLELAFNPQRSEKILNPIINSSRSNNNNNNKQQQQKENSKKSTTNSKTKKRSKKEEKLKPKTYDEDSSSSVELIDVSEPPQIPEHNLSYTQITEALSSASTGLTAIQPVEVIESRHDEDRQMTTTELTPLTTLTSLTNLTPLTPLEPTAIYHHSGNDANLLQSQQSHLHVTTSTSMELASLEPSTISEATKLSLTLLEPSALSELTAFTEPSTVHTSNLTELTSSYGDHSGGLLHHQHSMLTEFTSSSTPKPFESSLITTQCNSSSTMLNTSSASSDYAVTNMDTSQITQQAKKPRISDSNMHSESFTMLDDNLSQTDNKSQSENTNFSTYDGTNDYLSSKISDPNMTFTNLGLSTRSIISDSTSLEPLTYSDSMPLSEATTILELTSSSHPTSSSEATAFSESNNHTLTVTNTSTKKKRNSSGKQTSKKYKPLAKDVLNLEGDYETSFDNNHFQCTLCRRVYDCWVKFRKHNEYHVIRPYQCPICPCNFKTNEELFEHNKVHQNTEKSFPCEICNRVFISKSRLKAHTITVHNEEREFKCGYCPSAFKTKSRLVDHVRKHTGEKPIKCHYCDEHFSRATYRLKHERSNHTELLEIDTKHREEKVKEKKNAANEK